MNDKKLQSFEDLFGKVTDSIERKPGIIEIQIEKLKPFKNHPFRIYEGKRLEDMVQSIREMGIILPIIVRTAEAGEYEILSGHNRVNAAKLAGLKEAPAVIREALTDEEAMIIVTETNLMQRSFTDLLPSEKAKALKVHYDTLAKQGRRTDLIFEIKKLLEASDINESVTSPQVAEKLKSMSDVENEYGLSRDTIARYIRLNYLIPDILKLVDDKEIAFIPAVTLSFISEEVQSEILNEKEEGKYSIDMKKAASLRKYYDEGKLDTKRIKDILSGELSKTAINKTKPKGIRLKAQALNRYFKPEQKQSEIEEIIEKALELYFASEPESM